MTLTNKRDSYDFSTTLNNITISGVVEVINNEIFKIQSNTSSLTINYQDNGSDYSLNIFGDDLSKVAAVADNFSTILNDIKASL